MSKITKACTITEEEIETLISSHLRHASISHIDFSLDRLNYLNKRLKAFKEEKEEAEKTNTEPVPEPQPAKTGW